VFGFLQSGHTQEAKQSAPPSSGGSQDKEKKTESANLVTPPLFSKPSVQDVVQPVSEPLFSRSSKLSPQEVEKEKEAAALAWAAAEEQPTHPETESISKGILSEASDQLSSLFPAACSR
jgi:hypothetical protein